VKVSVICMYSFLKENNFSCFLKKSCQICYYSFTSPVNKIIDVAYDNRFKIIGCVSSVIGVSVGSIYLNQSVSKLSPYEFGGKIGEVFESAAVLSKKTFYNLFRIIGNAKDGVIFGLWGNQWEYFKDLFKSIAKKK